MTVSVLIPTAGRPAYLDVALGSLPRGLDVIVVLDGPDDGGATAAVCARHGARLHVHGARHGINVARNTAIAGARGELLCFLDDDVRVWPGWLEALTAAAAAHPEVECFAGPIRPVFEGGGPRMCGREDGPITSLDLGPGDREAAFAWGANLAVRRSALERIGTFDPALADCGDEEDWQRRLRAAGGTVRYVAAAGVDHRRVAADATVRALARAAWYRGRAARRYDEHKGTAPPVARELRVLAGTLWHTVRRRCANGPIMAVRTLGRLREALLTVALLMLLAPALAGAAPQLVEIKTPSVNVDPADVAFNGADHPRELRAKVLLPSGYDGHRRFPVLYLLHGVGDRWDSWADPAKGAVADTVGDLPAIVVMPEAARGFYTNHWNGGTRGKPGWERFYLDELIEQVEDRFPIARGRAQHAIAGLSMGGFGALYLAGQRPDYFGSAASFSGALNIQRPEVPLATRAFEVDYETVFGPRDGFYAAGHNPTALAGNLRWTPVFQVYGDGIDEPGRTSNPLAGVTEAGIKLENEDFTTSARAAGVPLTARAQHGTHDWPYWRDDLRAAIDWGLFGGPAAPAGWEYETVAQSGRAWGFTYSFDPAPSEVVRFSLRDGRLAVGGSGKVAITAGDGCSLVLDLPARNVTPPGGCAAPIRPTLELTVRPRTLRSSPRPQQVRFRAFIRRQDGGRQSVAGALVRFAGRRQLTDGDGFAVLRVRVAGHAGTRLARVQKAGLRPGLLRVRVRR